MSEHKENTLTLEELGELIPCAYCKRPTYKSDSIDKEKFNTGWLLPEGFTVGNKRMWVHVKGETKTVCQNCRYDPDIYGRY